jgi:hypothetical protein
VVLGRGGFGRVRARASVAALAMALLASVLVSIAGIVTMSSPAAATSSSDYQSMVLAQGADQYWSLDS